MAIFLNFVLPPILFATRGVIGFFSQDGAVSPPKIVLIPASPIGLSFPPDLPLETLHK